MFYYPNWIKFYKNAISFINEIEEIIHIIGIKNFFKQTKIKKDYEKQILDYNIKKFGYMIIAD